MGLLNFLRKSNETLTEENKNTTNVLDLVEEYTEYLTSITDDISDNKRDLARSKHKVKETKKLIKDFVPVDEPDTSVELSDVPTFPLSRTTVEELERLLLNEKLLIKFSEIEIKSLKSAKSDVKDVLNKLLTSLN